MEVEDYSSVKRWLRRLGSVASRAVHRRNLKRFMVWLRSQDNEFSFMGPDDLVDYQIRAYGDRSKVFRLLDLAEAWVLGLEGLRARNREMSSL